LTGFDKNLLFGSVGAWTIKKALFNLAWKPKTGLLKTQGEIPLRVYYYTTEHLFPSNNTQ
jgi:carbohydrate-selective porin OprB